MGCLGVESIITMEGSVTGTLLITYSSYPTEQVWSKLSGSPSPLTAVGGRRVRSMPVCSAPKWEQGEDV